MNFDDLKDQLRDQVTSVWGRIQENSAYNNLKEHYETLPVVAQRSIAYASGVAAVLVVLSIPFSYIGSSKDALFEFEDHRALIRELVRVSRAAKDAPALPSSLSNEEIQSQVRSIISQVKLMPEQFVGTQPLPDRPAGNLAPSVLKQNGVGVAFKKLNLTQILDVGYQLQSMSSGVKMAGIDILASHEDSHYYDVTYKLVSFSMPLNQVALDPESKGPGRGGRKPPGRSGDTEDDL